MTPLALTNLIGSERCPAAQNRTFEDRNPADATEVVAIVPRSGPEDVDRAVRAAQDAFATWRKVPAPKRAELLFKAAGLLLARKEDLARIMTREMGKVLVETRGDAQEAIDTAFYAGGEGRRLFGDTAPCELPDKFGMSVRMPVGVCGLITPWNFPVAIPSWKIFPALVAGNTVVLKPSNETPASAQLFVDLLVEAGVPPGVVNVVHGMGREVGTALVEHPLVRLISLTGSVEVGRAVAGRCGQLGKKVALELGGKNAQIVMDDADLDLALEGALWGSFGTTGQRCTATSRLILHRKIAHDFTRRLVERARTLEVGNGLDPQTQMGPVINEDALKKVEEYVQVGRQEGAKLLLGGQRLGDGALARGWFYAPTIFGDCRHGMRITKEEIFGPVLSVIPVKDFDEAIAVLNDTEFGLSSSIYTRDVNAAFQAIRDIEAGITYINGPTIGAEVQLPFGGVKSTGNGRREAGWQVLETFTEWKSVYVDYSGRLQRAQID